MNIFTWLSANAPEGQRGVARMQILNDHPDPAKRRLVWHPVVIHAATEAEAGAKALAWWDAEVAKERARIERGKALARRRHAAQPAGEA